MTKKIVFHFAVEEEDLPDFLSGLYSLCASPLETSENLAVIEDFYILKSRTFFDDLGLPPERKNGRDPKSGWPVND